MKPIVVATGNRGKLREIREILKHKLIPYTKLLGKLKIEETGNSFKENGIIKAREVFTRLNGNYLVLADDSGLVVPALGGIPGVYSSRFAGEGATEEELREKLIGLLREKGLERTPAYYISAIALATPFGIWTAHGFMYGEVITEERGNWGFGYDPIFIPKGEKKTLGELPPTYKNTHSHRRKGLENLLPLLEVMEREWADGSNR